MLKHTTHIRVNYGETDNMGFVHHSNYARYYETARWEMFRDLGISYKSIEQMGLLMAVVDMNISYKKPAFYDDQLDVITCIVENAGACIQFHYKILNEKGECINTADMRMAFIKKSTNRSCKPPQKLIDILQNEFVSEEQLFV
ncbi:MAG: acyl-CoA thioesterase [Bacteroidales bacterium]|nr:acyl-CoA thioesterase [Bacteroidales bacterium]